MFLNLIITKYLVYLTYVELLVETQWANPYLKYHN